MRVAVTLEKFDLLRGGAEVATLRLVQELVAREHEVHVVTTAVDVSLPANVRVHLVSVPGRIVAWRQISFARHVAAQLRSLGCELSVASCGRGFSEDVLWAQNGTHRAAAAGKARSYYYSPVLRAASRYQDFLNLRTFVYRELERRHFARRPQPYVIAPSRMIAEGFERDHGLRPEHLRVVPYQVNLQRFAPDRIAPLRTESRASLNLQPDELAVLTVAQNFRRKGVRPLIEAAAVLRRTRPQFRVLIAGLTPRHARPYEALARRRGCAERVRFLGQHPRIEALYAAADVFCLPTFFDPCAIASIEAMACGLPSVTSRYNGAAELITHEVDGFVVSEPQDATALAAQIEPLFDVGLRQKIGAAAAETAQRLSRNNPANEIARVVEDLAHCRRKVTGASVAPSGSRPAE